MNLNSESWLVLFDVINDHIEYRHLLGFDEIPDQKMIDKSIKKLKNEFGDEIDDLSHKILSEKDGFELARIMFSEK